MSNVDWTEYGRMLAAADERIGNLPEALGAVRESRIVEYAAAKIAELVPDATGRRMDSRRVVDGYGGYIRDARTMIEHAVNLEKGAALVLHASSIEWSVGITAHFAIPKADFARISAAVRVLCARLDQNYIAEWSERDTATHLGVVVRNVWRTR